jgi:hypothetical protein
MPEQGIPPVVNEDAVLLANRLTALIDKLSRTIRSARISNGLTGKIAVIDQQRPAPDNGGQCAPPKIVFRF